MQIHIQLDDRADGARLVAYLSNLTTISAVLVDYRDSAEVHDLSDIFTASAVSAATETGPRHLDLVRTITDYEFERARQRYEARRARLDEDDKGYEYVCGFDCPHCGALAGKPCQRPNGRWAKRPYTHARRRRVAWENHPSSKPRVDDRSDLITADAVDAQRAQDYRMCKCSHTNHVHSNDMGCVIDGCACEAFDQVQVDWIGTAVTLDEM